MIGRAIQAGVNFLLDNHPAEAGYPNGWAEKPSGNWWKFGFPVFYVADRGQKVVIEKRRTDWFYIKTERGVEGWVNRDQILATLETTGEPLDLDEPSRSNYMSRRWQGGVLAGDFDGASEISVFGGYAFSDQPGDIERARLTQPQFVARVREQHVRLRPQLWDFVAASQHQFR